MGLLYVFFMHQREICTRGGGKISTAFHLWNPCDASECTEQRFRAASSSIIDLYVVQYANFENIN